MEAFEILVHPDFIHDQSYLLALALKKLPKNSNINPLHFNIVKQSIDARMRMPHYRLLVNFNHTQQVTSLMPAAKSVSNAPEVHIVGAGPAGYFAALTLISQGFKPVIFERGLDVRSRRRDLAAINKHGVVNPESNYCFGEGGAGTYSDGKLYTRSNKRGDVQHILQLFVHFGASKQILIDAHPHIGTNKLPQIMQSMRQYIQSMGGEIHFGHKLTGISHALGKINNLQINHSTNVKPAALLLATGHSARDIFDLLHAQNIVIEAKPFALGVRIEHPQPLIDQIFYHHAPRHAHLPPASYKLLEQVQGGGVFSFCMCPGGIIAPCATNENEIVTNGWSPSKRNNAFANAGFVTEISLADAQKSYPFDAFATRTLQSKTEQQAFVLGNGMQRAPAQKIADFVSNQLSTGNFETSYQPGYSWANLNQVLPQFVSERLKNALILLQKRYPALVSNEGIMLGPESRTSSPIRIPRLQQSGQHIQIQNLFPCAEGAGYAGGIVSAAIDGVNQAHKIVNYLKLL